MNQSAESTNGLGLDIGTKQNRINSISNVYIVYSFQHYKYNI